MSNPKTKSKPPTPAESVAGEGLGASPVRNPLPVSEIDMAFGGNIDKLLPPWEEIPEDFKRDRHPFKKVVSKWFFGGLPAETDFQPKPGVDANAALRHVATILRSFQPKHEHKEAGCAYLLSLWFTDIRFPNDGAEARQPATSANQ